MYLRWGAGTVLTKSASLSVRTSKISFCSTKYFILSDKCPAEITKITMMIYRTVLQNWVLSYTKLQSTSCPAAEKIFHDDWGKNGLAYSFFPINTNS